MIMNLGIETEIELKFLLTPAIAAALRASPTFLPIEGTQEHDPIANYYYDTAQFDLQQRGFALRLRKKKGQFIQSLKGGGYSDAALHSRQEWNQFIPHLVVEPHLLLDTPIADLVTAGKITADLKPIFLTDIQRELWQVQWKQSVVEIALDQGYIVIHDHKKPLNELEIELVSGTLDDLLDLAKHVQTQWGLQAIEVSKAAQGYAFLASLHK